VAGELVLRALERGDVAQRAHVTDECARGIPLRLGVHVQPALASVRSPPRHLELDARPLADRPLRLRFQVQGLARFDAALAPDAGDGGADFEVREGLRLEIEDLQRRRFA